MQTFKKIIIASASFVIALSILSAIIIEPCRHSETSYYQDGKLRDMLAGQLDYLIVGASHGLAAFIPDVLDKKLGCNSYNLSSSLATMKARVFLTEQELHRNPVDTVVLEISYNALRSTLDEYGDGDSTTFARLSSWRARRDFLIKSVPFDDWMNIYSRDLISGLSYWQQYVQGNLSNAVDYQAKGYHPKESFDRTLSPEEIEETYNAASEIPEFAPDTLESFQRLVDLCKENNCRVIIVTTPLTDEYIWRGKDWDVFHDWMEDFRKENNCEYYDFNLLKERYALWSDQDSFFDSVHMSDQGAHVFSEAFAKIMNQVDCGEDVSTLFYESYAEMKQDSPYMDIYKGREYD